jgi:hypothetical protein
MTNDVTRTELTLTNDPRLIAAVGAVVSWAAARAGLSGEAEKDLDSAADSACHRAFSFLARKAHENTIKVIVAVFPDRIELTIEHPGEVPQLQGTSFSSTGGKGTAGKFGVPMDSAKVDRVECKTLGGRSRTTLVKYCGARTPSASS